MICKKCGAELPEGATACPKCLTEADPKVEAGGFVNRWLDRHAARHPALGDRFDAMDDYEREFG